MRPSGSITVVKGNDLSFPGFEKAKSLNVLFTINE